MFQKKENCYISVKCHEMLYPFFGQKSLPIRGVIFAYADIGHCTHFDFFLQILQWFSKFSTDSIFTLCVDLQLCTNDFALSPPSISSVLPTDCVEIDSALSGTTFRLNYSSYVRPPAFSLTSCCWGTQSTPLKTSTEIFSFRLMFW